MRRTVLKTLIFVSVVGSCFQLLATTGELRTPLARFPYHYPLMHVDNDVDVQKDSDWSFNCFKSAYMRSADSGYDKCESTKKVPLAQLFFGKSSFKAQEAFFGAEVDSRSCPALKYVVMKPRFKYRERGCNLGLDAEYRLQDSKWRFGGSLSLPYKVIELERNVCSATMTAVEGGIGVDPGDGLDLSGVVCRRQETLEVANGGSGNATGAVVPAYRLDFLTGLSRSNGMPMVEYGDGWMKIAGVEVALYKPGASVNNPAVVGIRNTEGTCPEDQYATPDATAVDFNAVNIDGVVSRLNNNYISPTGTIIGPIALDPNRGPFKTGINYATLGGLTDAQAELFIVPTYDSETGDNNVNTRFHIEAVQVMNAIEEAIDDLQDGGVSMAEQFFFNNGVHFCQVSDGCSSARNMGVGDLEFDVYGAWGNIDDYWGKLILGVVFPTGKKICDPGLLLSQPTGNNGHFEMKFGLQGGWFWDSWFGLHADVSYNHVFEATENRAAPFLGATVKNIGPCVRAKTKWGYVTGHIDLTVFHPENADLGCSFGYEIYHKLCDKIKLCSTHSKEFPLRAGCSLTGPILNDELKELDCSILAKDTKRTSHKFRCQVFHRWNYCELFGGGSYVFAGKNIMQETEAHLGVGIYW